MNAPAWTSIRLLRWRKAPHYLTSFLAMTAQRNAVLKPCVRYLLQSGMTHAWWRVSLPAGLTLAGTHSLSGATTEVSPAAGSPNPASAKVGVTFSWFFTSTGSNRAHSYTVSGLPAGLAYKYGSPVSSITGKPTAAGTSKITIKGWENSNRTGASTPVYTLTLNTTSSAPVITLLSSGGEYAAGSAVTLEVTATGTNLTYQWKRNDVTLTGATGSSHVIPELSEDSAGTYTVVVSSGATSVTSSAILIGLIPAIDAWTATHWSGSDLTNPLISGPGADPDGDGIENVLEYVLDLNPTTFTAAIPDSLGPDPADDQYLLYSVPLNPEATDYTVRFQRSTDLASDLWSTVDEADPANLVTRTPSLLTMKIPRSETSGFIRLVSTVR